MYPKPNPSISQTQLQELRTYRRQAETAKKEAEAAKALLDRGFDKDPVRVLEEHNALVALLAACENQFLNRDGKLVGIKEDSELARAMRRGDQVVRPQKKG